MEEVPETRDGLRLVSVSKSSRLGVGNAMTVDKWGKGTDRTELDSEDFTHFKGFQHPSILGYVWDDENITYEFAVY